MDQHSVYRFDNFVVDPEAWRLTRGGQEIHIEPVVLKLLIYLITERGRVVTRHELMDTVWGDTVISESALTKAVARLRKALGDDSDPYRFLETVRSQGYRFTATVEESRRPDGAGPMSAPTAAFITRRSLVAGAAALVLLIILAVLWFRSPQQETPETGAVRSLAVLPLSNLTGDPDKAYYADGLQELLLTALAQLPGLRVTSRQSTMRYRNSQLPTADIAGELGVDALVEGSLLQTGSDIDITVQLIDGRSDEHLWAERFTSEAPHGISLIADIADAIGAEIGAIRVPRGLEEQARDRMSRIDPRALDAYLMGTVQLDRFTPDGIRTAIDQLQTAVAIEPELAQAWSRLAGAYAFESMFGLAPPGDAMELARAAALRAVEVDEHYYGGHSALGFGRLWTGDIEGACESFDVAIRLNPSATNAIHGQADCLMFVGRVEESLDLLHELLFISPFSAFHSMPLPIHLYMAGRQDEAIAVIMSMRERTPQYALHWVLANIYWQQERFDMALEEERLELEQRGDSVLLAVLEEGLGNVGPAGVMRAMAEALIARAAENYVDPFHIARYFARAGLADETLHWLDRAVELGSYETAYIAFWPYLDFLRADPRFRDLLERVYGPKARLVGQPGFLSPEPH